MDSSSVCARVGGRSSGYCLGLSGNSVIETATPRPITKAGALALNHSVFRVEPFNSVMTAAPFNATITLGHIKVDAYQCRDYAQGYYVEGGIRQQAFSVVADSHAGPVDFWIEVYPGVQVFDLPVGIQPTVHQIRLDGMLDDGRVCCTGVFTTPAGYGYYRAYVTARGC